jgi:transglutaminase-like putative cysteine protease
MTSGASGRTYRVEHSTNYTYSEDVRASYGRAHLLPRTAAGQVVVTAELAVDPIAEELRDHVDFFGNVSTYYVVRTPHRALSVTATSEVRVERSTPDQAALDEHTCGSIRTVVDGDVEACSFVLTSPLVRHLSSISEYAAQTLTDDRPLGAALTELMGRIHADFDYVSGSTSVNTRLSEVMHKRQGVCQDFAHLAVACLRSAGLPARYVSGYLETVPPPGRPKLQGADASHAWASVLVPTVGWVDLDPTNDQFVDDRYVITGWGRDYSDVPPLKGVILTHAKKSTMKVAVDVSRIA